MEYLIAVDLEGIHGVVGEPYLTLTAAKSEYELAIEGAYLEINTAVKALFDNGATAVSVWDNHGSGKNLDFSHIDSGVKRVDTKNDTFRFDFVNQHKYAAILFLGYHAKEGTPGGILAHTYSSVGIQYVKLNGEAVGELGIDTYICDSYGIPPIFAASDERGVEEIRAIYPTIKTVITKYGSGRNSATLRDRDTVLREIYDRVVSAVRSPKPPLRLFPENARIEIRYTRAEKAAEKYEYVSRKLNIPVSYGEDTHILHFEVSRPNIIPALL